MRIVLLAIQMVFVAIPLPGEDALQRAVGSPYAVTLRSGATVRRSMPADGSVTLMPSVSSSAKIAGEMQSFHPTVGVEIMRLIGRAWSTTSAPGEWLRLYNSLHAASTMEGIRYFSESRGKEEILFRQSYSVGPPGSAREVPDPTYSTIPAESVDYTFQEDNSFGKNTYAETFSFPGDHLSVKIENLTAISLLFIPIIRPHGFVVRIVLLPQGSDILFYGAAVLRTTFPIGDRRSREESLYNRLIALMNWLQRQLAAP